MLWKPTSRLQTTPLPHLWAMSNEGEGGLGWGRLCCNTWQVSCFFPTQTNASQKKLEQNRLQCQQMQSAWAACALVSCSLYCSSTKMKIIFLRLYHWGWTFHEQQDTVFSVVCVCVCVCSFLCVSDRSVVSYSTNDSHLPLAAVEEEDWSSNILSNWSISVSCLCCTSLDVAALTNGGSDDKCRTSGKELEATAMVHEEGDEELARFLKKTVE